MKKPAISPSTGMNPKHEESESDFSDSFDFEIFEKKEFD
jgi:hypothetical protein